ncbi:hypothetical protein WJT86_10765, partial [Microvirga sp. W0021]
HSDGSSMNVGGSLTIGYGVSGSLNAGGGNSTSDKAWVTEQTGIYAGDNLNITVGNHTQIDGAVINSETGNLTLDTGTLGFSDIVDHDTASSMNVNVGISNDPATGKPSGGSISGSVSDRDREQVNHATVGEGEITIRNQEDQKQDVAALNRDVEKAQEITKDESSGVDFYVSSSAIEEIASEFETTRNNLKKLESAASNGFEELPNNIRESLYEAAQGVSYIDKSIADAAKEIILKSALSSEQKANVDQTVQDIFSGKVDLKRVLGCNGGGTTGFNILEFFVTTAHASSTGCGFLDNNGNYRELSASEWATCVKILTLAVANVMTSKGSIDQESMKAISGLADALRDALSDQGFQNAAMMTAELSGAVRKTLLESILGEAEYKKLEQAIENGSDDAAQKLAAIIDEWGESKGLSNQQISDLKLVSTVSIAATSVIVGGKRLLKSLTDNKSGIIVPGRVASRINLRTGNSDNGWTHVVEVHYSGKSNKSQFSISQNELRSVLQADARNSPIVGTSFSTEHGILYVRQYSHSSGVGVDYLTGKSTNTITIFTDSKGNLITAFPGVQVNGVKWF